ncbi:MAG: SDR family NAD(P)-dependent oxidoreductase, partial [Phycisphaerae bacterium]|nr:SDR family NAD(P)-dependent oxidoreductase [Phycisphaerae bacterium]
MVIAALFDLSGKTALVTGASSGIGRALAQGLAAAGAAVVVAARRRENLERVVEAVELSGAGALAVCADLARPADRRKLIEKSLAWRGGIDVLVNCAGINRRAPAVDLSVDDWQAVLDLDLTVPFLLSQGIGRA